MRLSPAPFFIALFLAARVAPAQAPAQTPNPIVKFSGEVSRGKRYEHQIRGDLRFQLFDHGGDGDFEIEAGRKDHQDHFASVATWPAHGPNSREIMAWHFLGKDPQPGLGKEREFYFATNDADARKLSDKMEKLVHSYSYTRQEIEAAEKIEVPVASGKLRIKEIKFGKLKDDDFIEYMKFDVEIDLPGR